MEKIKIKPERIVVVCIIVLIIILLIVFIIISNKNDEPKENETNAESNETNETNTEATYDTNGVFTENDLIENSTENDENESSDDEEEETMSLGDFIQSDRFESVNSATTFYTVKGYIDDFFECIANSDNSKLINILDEEYINRNSLNISNVSSMLEDYNYPYTVKDIYEYAYTSVLRTFLVEINQNDEIKYIYFALDYSTGAYKIYINEDESKYESINEESIEQNEDNQFSFTTVSDSTMCKNYLNMFIDEIENDLDNSYYLLDEEYRETAFTDKNDYISYMNENMDMYLSATANKYKVVVNGDGTTEYTIIDNYDNYYIIYATSVMNYTIRLSK